MAHALEPYLATLFTLPWKPNQDYHPMNIIHTSKGLVKIDQGSSYQTIPCTYDIASLILFDTQMTADLAQELVQIYCTHAGQRRHIDTYLRSLAPSLYYRATYMSSTWQDRAEHRTLQHPVLTNASRLITSLAKQDTDQHLAHLLAIQRQSLE